MSIPGFIRLFWRTNIGCQVSSRLLHPATYSGENVSSSLLIERTPLRQTVKHFAELDSDFFAAFIVVRFQLTSCDNFRDSSQKIRLMGGTQPFEEVLFRVFIKFLKISAIPAAWVRECRSNFLHRPS